MTMQRIVVSLVCLALILASRGSCYAAATAHDIVKVYLASAQGGQRLEMRTIIDRSEVDCPHTVTSCTLVLSAMDEVCASDIAPWQIIVFVNGAPVDRQPVWQPGNTKGRNCATGNWQGFVAVRPGRYFVDLATAPQAEVQQSQWSATYTVTTP
jgi:hypothetical protein